MNNARIRNLALSGILLLGICFSMAWPAFATAPNPGHNFTEVGGGVVQGDLLYGSAADTLAALAKNATASRYLSNSGTSNNPAWAQVDLTNGVVNALGLGNGGTGQASAAAARGSSGLNIDQMTGHGDSIYTILATDRAVVTNAAFTASRTWTLPAASAVNAGQTICVSDLQGTVTSTNTLVISRAGSDTIDGATSLTFSTANDGACLTSDGTSKWTVVKYGLEIGGTGAALAASNGGICYSTASALSILAGTATANKLLVSGASGAPSWSVPTFPNASATSGKIIKSDGTNWVASTETYATPGSAGNLMESDGTNWTSVVGGVLIARQALTNGTTTYTPTAGTHEIRLQLWGAGGAGGSCTAVAGCASGGGGSGGYAEYFLTGVTGTYTVAIGAGGTAAAGTTGNSGGNTTFNTGATTITAFGGSGGTTAGGTAATKYTAGGAGGVVSTNGTVNGAGTPGEFGSTSATATIGATGNGGSTSLGGGGVGKVYSSAAAVVGAAAIQNTGSGGSGGGTGTATVAAGGAGANGLIIIWEYR